LDITRPHLRATTRDFFLKALGLLLGKLLPPLLEFGKTHEPRILTIRAHPRRIHIDNLRDRRDLRFNLEELIHLLLVLSDDHGGMDPINGKSELLWDGGGEEVEGGTSQYHDRHFGKEPFRMVIHDDDEGASPTHSQSGKPKCRPRNLILIILPRIGFPDSIGLLPHGDVAPPQLLGLGTEHLGDRRDRVF